VLYLTFRVLLLIDGKFEFADHHLPLPFAERNHNIFSNYQPNSSFIRNTKMYAYQKILIFLFDEDWTPTLASLGYDAM